ncbi:MAG: type II secretion system F family protein [Anaerolineae bacterium]|nr:type II secretion system F family protein [Anaerolineae bacterium]
MALIEWVWNAYYLHTPVTFALLCGLGALCLWLAFRPRGPIADAEGRLEAYAAESDVIEEVEMRRSIIGRVFVPMAKRILQIFGKLGPKRNIEALGRLLAAAGRPGGLDALDFIGLQMLIALALAGAVLLWTTRTEGLLDGLWKAAIAALLGFVIPYLWLRSRVDRRRQEILRALPDALDMLTIGVEAGLAFESAMVRVGEQWDNALTREFRRMVTEARLGTPRNTALQRMADRVGVHELTTFVAVLIQSTQLGVSIAHVLHTQADQMRIKRRQRAEELARQAGVKMVFPLALMIFPALLVVLLGPGLPALFEAVAGLIGAPSILP